MSYSLGDLVGEGSDAQIYELLLDNEKTGKVVRFVKTDTDGLRNYLEPYIAIHLRHKNIANAEIIEMDDDGLAKILYKQADYDLSEFINSNRLKKKTKLDICLSLAKAVAFLHSYCIIHGDIKPSNVLVYKEKENEYTIKLNDFGLSQFSSGEKKNVKMLYTYRYKPPEVLKNEYVSLKSDIWALGCTFYEIYYGTPYFELNGKRRYHIPSNQEKKSDKDFLMLIDNMICEEIKRFDINDVCSSLVLKCKDCENISSRCLSINDHIIQLESKSKDLNIKDTSEFLNKCLFLQNLELKTCRIRNAESYKQEKELCNEFSFDIFGYIKR